MKKLLALFIAVSFAIPYSFAANRPAGKIKNPPQGTFRKAKDGTIIQYDKNGRIIGKYNLSNGSKKKHK